jgi:hypothetical protein
MRNGNLNEEDPKGFQEPWPDPGLVWPDGFDRPSWQKREDADKGGSVFELADRILAAVNAQPRTPTREELATPILSSFVLKSMSSGTPALRHPASSLAHSFGK